MCAMKKDESDFVIETKNRIVAIEPILPTEVETKSNLNPTNDLSLELDSKLCLEADDETPKVEIPEYDWYRNAHASIDLDDKFSTMTGSYSEILDDHSNDKNVLEEALQNEINPQLQVVSHSTIEDDISPTNPITGELSDNPELFREDPTTIPWYENSSRRIPPGPLTLYAEPPVVDPTVLSDLEDYARHIANSMDCLTENLTESLHGISALSVDCVETYRNSVCKTCDAVDSNIKSMYQLMAKCEELSKAMKPMYKLQEQIKDIRRLLDMFESAVYSSGS